MLDQIQWLEQQVAICGYDVRVSAVAPLPMHDDGSCIDATRARLTHRRMRPHVPARSQFRAGLVSETKRFDKKEMADYPFSRLFCLVACVLWLLAFAQGTAQATAPHLDLTAEERSWLERHPRIVLGISDQFQPDIFVAPDGSRSGLVVDYFDLLNQQLGGRLHLHVEGDWQAITAKALRGEIDGLASSAPNAIWDRHFLYTRPYYYGYLHIYVRSDAPSARNLEDLAGKRVGYLSGMALVERTFEDHPAVRLVGLDGHEQMARALLEAEVDAVIGIVDLEWWRRSNSILGFRISGLLEGSRHPVLMSIRNDWPLLPGIIDKAMAHIPDAERNRIAQTWLSSDVRGLQDLYLSDSEHAYLQGQRFRRATSDGYQPFNFVDSNGRLIGIAEDYWALVRSKLQLEVEDRAPESFSGVLGALQRNEADFYVGTTRTRDLDAYAVFSDSLEQFPIGLAIRQGSGFITDAAALEGRVVAVGRNSGVHHRLRERYPGIEFLEVADTAGALDAVAAGRAVAAADVLPVLQHLIAARDDRSLRLGGVTGVFYTLQIMLSKEHERLLPLLNRAIAAIDPEERLAIHKQWLWRDVVTQEKIDFALIWKIAIGALLLVLIVLLWNHQLSRQIKRRIKTERQLHETGERLRSILVSLDDLVFVFDKEERIIDAYYQHEQPLMTPPPDFLGKPWRDILPKEIHDQLQQAMGQLRNVEAPQFEYCLATPMGQRWWQGSVTARYEAGGDFVGCTVVARDITIRKQAEAEVREAAILFDLSNNGVVLTDTNGIILRVNPAFTEITGYSAAEAIGQKPNLLKSGHHPETFYQELWQTLLGDGVWEGEIWNRHKSGRIAPFWERIVVIRDTNGRISGYLSQFGDIARRKLTEEEIRQRGNYDGLTGLANRGLFMERLDLAVREHRRRDRKLAVLMVSIDRFRQINETLGYLAGDELLKQVALRLRVEIGELDTAARVGGDEFALLLTDQDDQIAVEECARRVLANLSEAYTLPGGNPAVRSSIGITVFPDDADSAEGLLRNANVALSRAKEVGGAHFYFTEAMGRHLLERHRLEMDLRGAVAEKELEVHYQPIVSLSSGQVCGVESLLRWRNSEYGMISPSKFIPIAESSGLIQPIGIWTIETVCRQLQTWHATGLNLYASVNVSPRQIPDGVSPRRLRELAEEFGVAPELLVLEITESTLAEDFDVVANWLREVRAHGFRVYLDDFGTGYSSLSYLKNFPVDAVKIDQSFIRDMVENDRDHALVETIIGISKTLGLQVVVEGVETAKQRHQLREMSCTYGQGYLFSRPQPPALLDAWLLHNLRPLGRNNDAMVV